MNVLFDLDGTLADVRHRLHFIQEEEPNWDAFFEACDLDVPIEVSLNVMNAHIVAGHSVEIWTGRSDVVRVKTEFWLEQQGIDPARLTFMRPEGNHKPDDALKREWLKKSHWKPDLVYEDRYRVVKMWREKGIACYQVAPGNF